MSCLISGIRWRHRTWIQVETRERYTDDILLRIHNVLIKAQRPLREESQKTTWSFLSLVGAVSGRNWTQNPIVKGKNSLFLPLLLVECFLTVLGQTNSQEISINRPRKWNLLISGIFRSRWKLIWSTLLSANECTGFRSLIYWLFKPPKLKLFNNSRLTKRK